ERREYCIKHLTHDPKNIASIEKSGLQKNTLDAEDEYRDLKSITAFDFRDQLNKTDCPALITSGIYDPVNPPAKGEILHKLIKNNQFSKFPSDHPLRLECADKYKETVLNFLRK
ncbi:alpha/beta fold hydrolase, partial [Oenococcus oeni]